jgi:hypothetical protein
MMKVEVNVQLEVTTTQNVLWQSDKNQEVYSCRFLLRLFLVFLHVLY